MKILTWNINGIRACKQPLKAELADLSSDIICLQETKVTRHQLDEETAIQDGYNSFFSFSRKKSGYSGVATYCKEHATPVRAEEGLSGALSDKMRGIEGIIGHYGDLSEFTDEELINLDSEGRAVLTEHQYRDSSGETKHLVVINVYCPRADPDREGRLDYKLQFYKLLQTRAEALIQAKKHVIILGDFNVSHKPIDHCDPDADEEKFYAKQSRRWLENFLQDTPPCSKYQGDSSHQKAKHFVDTFRFFHPHQENAFTCWSTVTGARQTNYGTRIDYIVSDVKLCQEEFEDCEILQDFEGSDHCPVSALMKGHSIASDKLPGICTKFMPEFLGKQQKLSVFFKKDVKVSGSNRVEQNCGSQENLNSFKPQNLLGKRNIGMSKFGPPAKKSKMQQKTSSKKNASITTYFKRTPPGIQSLESDICQTDSQEQLSSAGGVIDSMRRPQLDDGNTCRDMTHSSVDVSSISSSSLSCKDKSVDTKCISVMSNKKAASSWRDIFKGPPPAPLCKGHKEPCVLRTVKKVGPNLGKQFYVCNKPEGHKSNPEARCGHFEWVVSLKKMKLDKTLDEK